MNRSLTVAFMLAVLYLLHNDFWLWRRYDTVLGGIPVGLAYHIGYCLLISLAMAFLVRRLGATEPADR